MVPISYTCSYDGGPEEDCKQKLLMRTHKLISFMFAGGAGPELALPLGRFVPGMQVRVTVTLRTDGGQSADTTVMFTAGDGEN